MDAPTTIGLDLGTSALKAVLVDADQRVLATAEVPLGTQRPKPLWSEQHPDAWWDATLAALATLRAQAPEAYAATRAIGLSGQMHGAVLLDDADRPIRPAILWNDGRAHEEAAALAREHPHLAAIVGVKPMPGLTAPKLAWLAAHEPEAFARIRTLLLPKDVIRLHLTGEHATDMSDAAGTWLLDQARRDWCDAALDAVALERTRLPRLVEGTKTAGTVRPALAAELGLPEGVIVAGGGGDVAAGAVGIGAVGEGDAFVSLGTSAQIFVASAAYRAAPEALVHAFCHCVPQRWFAMAAMLNGASVIAWAARLLGLSVADALALAERETTAPGRVLFLPYLAGERTPHDDPYATGVLVGLSHDTSPADIVRAVLDGLVLSLVDGRDALASAGVSIETAGLIGGGARSPYLASLLASALGTPLVRHRGAETGPAFGAARLAACAATGDPIAAVATPPPVLDVTPPDPALRDAYAAQLPRWRALYRALREEFRRSHLSRPSGS
ncbi:xylulokinase [Salinarimonas ramus]|uniref:Xylulose kinase n=1 Tax=Salinarimonas ramus TaxID=690164 RepID=A0A917Q6H9_9HYPH|nr:xylulokinase [Salinarimonas ramus]GGK30231.1 xylulokinase [Salinarimonas ramus]